MKTTAELREGFLSFFESKGHLRLPSGAVVPPPEDTSTLFTVAGDRRTGATFVETAAARRSKF